MAWASLGLWPHHSDLCLHFHRVFFLVSLCLLLFVFVLFSTYWPHCVACVVLAPWPEIIPKPYAVDAQGLNHWTTRNAPCVFFSVYGHLSLDLGPLSSRVISSWEPCLNSIWVHAKSLWSCQSLCDPMDHSPPGSSIHGILQARILEWVAMPSSRGSSQPRYRTSVSYVSCIGRQVLYC